MKIKIIEKTINNTRALHNITFVKNLKPITPQARKQGRPKFKWAEKGIKEYWETILKTFKYHPLRDYDQNDQEQVAFLKHYASAAINIPKEEWSKFKKHRTHLEQGQDEGGAPRTSNRRSRD